MNIPPIPKLPPKLPPKIENAEPKKQDEVNKPIPKPNTVDFQKAQTEETRAEQDNLINPQKEANQNGTSQDRLKLKEPMSKSTKNLIFIGLELVCLGLIGLLCFLFIRYNF